MRGGGELRTVRVPPELGWPDLERSADVCSVREVDVGRFVSFVPKSEVSLRFTDRLQARPHVRRCNARVTRWVYEDSRVRFALKGHLPVILVVAGVAGPCHVLWRGGELRGTEVGGAWEFRFPTRETGDAVLVCP